MKTSIAVICIMFLLSSLALALQLNDPAPSFSLRDINGGNFFFTDHIGTKKKTATKGMVLSFFASYCEPCRRELPVLNSLVEELEKKGLKVVIVGSNEDFDKFSAMLDELKVDKPIILFLSTSTSFAAAKPKAKPVENYLAVLDLESVGKVDKDVVRPLTDSVRREIVKSGNTKSWTAATWVKF